MTESSDFPAEFPADPEGSEDALFWTAAVILLVALALALLNAEAIVGWTEELPADPRTAKAMAAADAWHARTTELGLDTPHREVHSAWKRAEAMQWPEDSPS